MINIPFIFETANCIICVMHEYRLKLWRNLPMRLNLFAKLKCQTCTICL